MNIQIRDTAGHGPVYQQIRSQIAEQIASGELASGASLPSPATLARDCNVDKGEVSRAYFELEQEELIASRKSKNFLGEAVTSYSIP